MKHKSETLVKQYVEPRLIKRLRIYIIVMLIMLVVVVFEVITSLFSIQLAIIGIMSGLGIGVIYSRTYRLSWDEDTDNVIGRIDWIGAIILIFYLIFLFTRAYFLGQWIHGTPLLAFILSITAGTMLGSVISTRRSIKKVLVSLRLDKLPLPDFGNKI